MLSLTAGAARALMLHAQGLEPPPRRRARKRDVLAAIRRMAILQIDTIHVVERSPYLVLWSRLGDYRRDWLDALLAEREIFEYWAHEASFLPAERYPHFRHDMIDPGGLGWKYSHDWVEQHRDLVDAVHARVRREGPLRSVDFERTDGRTGAWWGWKPEKRALEMLFSTGELMVARRERFQRVYDLRERVRPDWHDHDLPPIEETRRTFVLDAIRALGITTTAWVADYHRTPKRETAALVEALGEQGMLVPARVAGWHADAWVHPDHVELATRAGAGRLTATHTTLLSPFDPIVWDRRRAREAFDFDYTLECYTPAKKRRWGYFVLPILRRGRLVGRVDAKAHRRDGVMEFKGVWLEDGVRISAALTRDLSRCFQRFAVWHDTPRTRIGRTAPAELRRPLLDALKDERIPRRATH